MDSQSHEWLLPDGRLRERGGFLTQNHVLVGISIETLLKFQTLKEIVIEISSQCEVLAASSIYKKFWNERKEDLNSELWLVLKISTSISAEEYLVKLRKIEKNNKRKILLLSFNDQVVLTPQLTLPHPKLAQEPIVLRCAAETWGDYEHPILRQNLNELVKSVKGSNQIQFFSQSRELFN